MSWMPDLTGRVAFVTGAARGIGAAIANALAEHGASVAVGTRSQANEATEFAARLAHDSGVQTCHVVGDLGVEETAQQAVAQIECKLGPVDILVNNAGGYPRHQYTTDTTMKDWNDLLRSNLTTAFLCSRSVIPGMQDRQWGRIINISSEAARMPRSVNAAGYTAAKAGLLGFTRHLALELAGTGVTVNAICPGSTQTERFNRLWSKTPGGLEAFVATIPIGRPGRPQEHAGLVLYLVSDLGGFATGATFDLNGGRVML